MSTPDTRQHVALSVSVTSFLFGCVAIDLGVAAVRGAATYVSAWKTRKCADSRDGE